MSGDNVILLMMSGLTVCVQVRGAVMITPEQVADRYIAVHHRMVRAANDEMSGCGLSMARTKVLTRLREQGPTRQSVLAADFGLSPHSITDIVDALERQGLAERRPDATDRRAKLVAITEAGEACLGVASAARERLLKQIFGVLSQEDRATLLRLLDALDDATRPLITTSAASSPPMVPA
jgi:DNA-binding MarR family transcriptional regulator